MTLRAYYNEWDKHAAAWLRELIRRGLIMDGDVDDRSITDVRPADLAGYTRVHFFAGIGGWDYALALAGWPEDRPVWTGSCPCQPFSVAGKAGGVGDERHLWPAFRALIAECRPECVFGEQVASKDGRLWLAGVRVDLERMGYAVGGADLCAAGVGAPHIRQRLYWVADAGSKRGCVQPERSGEQCQRSYAGGESADSGLADAALGGLGADGGAPGSAGHAEQRGEAGGVADSEHDGGRADEPERGPQGRGANGRDGEADTIWRDALAIPCRDGRTRRIPAQAQSCLQPVAAGLPGLMDALRDAGAPVAGIAEAAKGYPLAGAVPGRVMLLRGAGNAIVPPLAAEFIGAVMECLAPAACIPARKGVV